MRSLQSHLTLRLIKNKFFEPLPIHNVIQSLTTGLVPVCTYLSCIGEPRSGHSTADMASQRLNRWKNHFPGTAGYTHAGISSTSPVCPYPSLPQKHDADLCLACPLGPRAFCKASFYPAVNPPLWLHGVMQDLTLPYFTELHRISVKPLLQSVRVPKFNNSPAFIHPGLVLSAREHALDRSSNCLTIGTFYFDCNFEAGSPGKFIYCPPTRFISVHLDYNGAIGVSTKVLLL